jgi:hypothetical protein
MSSNLAWRSFFDVASLNSPGQSLPAILDFMHVPPSSEFDCNQVNSGRIIHPPFELKNRLASLLAIDMPVGSPLLRCVGLFVKVWPRTISS